jgi:Zinc finger, C3HC4 type (RING finger)
MAQPSQEYSTSEVDSSDSAASEGPSAKKIALSPRPNSHMVNTSRNGNQLVVKDKLSSGSNKHANSAGELSCNNNTSSDDCDEGSSQIDNVQKIKVSPSQSIEISKVVVDGGNSFSTTLAKLAPSHLNDKYLDYKLENKIIQKVYRQEFLLQKNPNSLDCKDSGTGSCQESSQEFSTSSQLEGGFLVRSSSLGSTRSFDSQNEFQLSQASMQIQQDSDAEIDTEDILTRVDEFTQKLQNRAKRDSSIASSPGASSKVVSYSSSSPEAQFADVNDSNLGICRFCMVNPKNGVFVHNNCLHLCCCYKCAVKVWKKRKSCPICNCKIKNVTKLFVH